MSVSPKFDETVFQNLLASSFVGRKIVYTDVTGSTMDDARRLAHDVTQYPNGTVVMSERQTKARGARDHKWDASNTGNIYVSFILHLPPTSKTFEGKFELEVAACLAVLQVVRKYGVAKAVPKWPNDVWVRGKKLAGFLAEDGRFDVPGSLNCLLILGIGINVNADVRRNSELQSIATSLLCERGGVPVIREEFFAEVCRSLEHSLSQSREEIWARFTKENLFQQGCDISVTCPSEGKVIDGQFLEICQNWEVRFSDKQSGEILQGRSDHYTIRPKVVDKILVVFTGLHDSKSAGSLSKWLMTVVDTSKYVVCLVPETSITSADYWMKSCSLLVLSEPMSDPDKVIRKLHSYLRAGGRIMASGSGSQFVAQVLDIPVQEIPVDSFMDESQVGFVCLRAQTYLPIHKSASVPVSTSDDVKQPTASESVLTSASAAAEDSIVGSTVTLSFSTTSTCFHFFEGEAALSSAKDSKNYTNGSKIKEQLGIVSSSQVPTNYNESNNNVNAPRVRAQAFYFNHEEQSPIFAIFTARIHTGQIALWGFDIGVNCVTTTNVAVPSEQMKLFETADADRFKRDILLQQVLAVLLDDKSSV